MACPREWAPRCVTQAGTWFVELKRIGGVAALTGALAMIAKAASPPARQTRDEIQDVYDILAPRGVAVIGGTKTVKDVPTEFDNWSHHMYDASGIGASNDMAVSTWVHMHSAPKRSPL